MLLTLSTTYHPASDLGFLLHKHPDRFQSFSLSFGKAHVFYPEVSDHRCTVCLTLDVDPVQLARRRQRGDHSVLAHYVNDRPYVASSFLSTAISQVFGSALSGRCKERPKLAKQCLPLEVSLDVLPVKGGLPFLERMFQPLGYVVKAEQQVLDDTFPDWGQSPYFRVKLSKHGTVSELLNHLYVLVPVFDHQKHYFTGPDELDKLLAKGDGWLADHPEKETIAGRYLKFQPSLARQAVQQLTDGNPDDSPESSEQADVHLAAPRTAAPEPQQPLNDLRLDAIVEELKSTGANRVIDLGCGEGKLLRHLMKSDQFHEIVGLDVSVKALEIASRRLRLNDLPPFQAQRIQLLHGSLMYRDQRMAGFDAAVLVEVIEHLDPHRLAAFERVVFEAAKPNNVIVTTPNSEYNVLWESLAAGRFRHSDHRFEWTRNEFQDWANGIAERFVYRVRFRAIGPVHDQHGSPTQMAVFQRAGQIG